jgi:hypothetical protein
VGGHDPRDDRCRRLRTRCTPRTEPRIVCSETHADYWAVNVRARDGAAALPVRCRLDAPGDVQHDAHRFREASSVSSHPTLIVFATRLRAMTAQPATTSRTVRRSEPTPRRESAVDEAGHPRTPDVSRELGRSARGDPARSTRSRHRRDRGRRSRSQLVVQAVRPGGRQRTHRPCRDSRARRQPRCGDRPVTERSRR